MSKYSVRLSDLSKMSSEEVKECLDKLVNAALNPTPEQIQEWEDEYEREVTYYETKYGVSSEEMRNRVGNGTMQETNEVCDWLMLLKKEERVTKKLQERNGEA